MNKVIYNKHYFQLLSTDKLSEVKEITLAIV